MTGTSARRHSDRGTFEDGLDSKGTTSVMGLEGMRESRLALLMLMRT